MILSSVYGKITFRKLLREGSYLCDTCMKLKESAVNMSDYTAKSAILQVRKLHRKAAKQESFKFRSINSSSRQNRNEPLHIFFEFSWIILLPSLLRQPLQQIFITGLQCDIFGPSVSNSMKNYIFGLVEGYWSGRKTFNEVASFVHHKIELC